MFLYLHLNEDSLYEYLERAIKVIHKVYVKLDNTFLYFLHLLQIPREILSHIHTYIINVYDKYRRINIILYLFN